MPRFAEYEAMASLMRSLKGKASLSISDVGRDPKPPSAKETDLGDGLDLARQLRAMRYTSPILFYTFSPDRVTSATPHFIATGDGSLLLNAIADVIAAEFIPASASTTASQASVGGF